MEGISQIFSYSLFYARAKFCCKTTPFCTTLCEPLSIAMHTISPMVCNAVKMHATIASSIWNWFVHPADLREAAEPGPIRRFAMNENQWSTSCISMTADFVGRGRIDAPLQA
jgi:hypothetical protein